MTDGAQPVAVLILGAESCGNRMTLRALRNSGFVDVSEARYETTVRLPPNGEHVVWLRSVPHAREWPDIFAMKEMLQRADYRVTALVPTRDWWCAIQSQVARGHACDFGEALQHLRWSAAIFPQLSAAGIPWAPVSYEAQIQDQKTVLTNALSLLDISCGIVVRDVIDDRNKKWM